MQATWKLAVFPSFTLSLLNSAAKCKPLKSIFLGLVCRKYYPFLRWWKNKIRSRCGYQSCPHSLQPGSKSLNSLLKEARSYVHNGVYCSLYYECNGLQRAFCMLISWLTSITTVLSNHRPKIRRKWGWGRVQGWSVASWDYHIWRIRHDITNYQLMHFRYGRDLTVWWQPKSGL